MEGGTSQGLVQSNILVGIKKKGVEPIFNKFGGRIGFFFLKPLTFSKTVFCPTYPGGLVPDISALAFQETGPLSPAGSSYLSAPSDRVFFERTYIINE